MDWSWRNCLSITGLSRPYSARGISEWLSSFPQRAMPPKDNKVVCFLRHCDYKMQHIRRHVVGRHLPKSFGLWLRIPLPKCLADIDHLLRQFFTLTNCSNLTELLHYVKRHSLYPQKSHLEIRVGGQWLCSITITSSIHKCQLQLQIQLLWSEKSQLQLQIFFSITITILITTLVSYEPGKTTSITS